MKQLFLSILTIFILLSCNSDDDNTIEHTSSNCTNASSLVINTNQYNSISENVNIEAVSLDGNCLTVQISGSGCSGATWVLNMKAEDAVSLSFPVQRNVALEFINQEACLAVFTREFVFDLTDLQVTNENQVIINIVNAAGMINNSITYSY